MIFRSRKEKLNVQNVSAKNFYDNSTATTDDKNTNHK